MLCIASTSIGNANINMSWAIWYPCQTLTGSTIRRTEKGLGFNISGSGFSLVDFIIENEMIDGSLGARDGKADLQRDW